MRNPFEALSPDRLAAVYRWPPEALRFIDGEADCLHVIGDAGMGKTTLLMQLQMRLEQAGLRTAYTYLPPDQEIDVESLPLPAVALIDEADRLSNGQVMKLLGRARNEGCRLAVGTHRDLRRSIRRARFSCLHVGLSELTAPEDLARIFRDRITLASETGQGNLELSAEAEGVLLRLSEGNIERCLEIGYEVFENLRRRSGSISAGDLAEAAEDLARATR